MRSMQQLSIRGNDNKEQPMSDWTVHLVFEEGNSSKFWRARVEGGTLYVNYGKIGTTGQTQVKDLGSPAGATKEYDKLIKEKTKKGYAEAGSESSPGAADDDSDDDEEEEEEAPKPARKAAPVAAAAPAAVRASGGTRLVLEAGGRRVETHLALDGKTLRMDSTETYATPEAAKKAHDRLKKVLLGEGYSEG
jgi:predicted DNA-binding WGR domain protein